MSVRSIKVGIVHDNFLTRAGLTTTFAACDDMVVEALGADDASLPVCHVVVADPRSGMDILAMLHTRPAGASRPRVAIIASSDREWQIRHAMAQGAAAYMLLGATGEELVVAVRTVYEGGCHLSPSIAAKLMKSLTAEHLTAREEEVLELVTDGLCNKRIAARLDISVGTVKTHLRAAFDKLGVGSRMEAVAMAERRGILRHSSVRDDAQGSKALLPAQTSGVPSWMPLERSGRSTRRDLVADRGATAWCLTSLPDDADRGSSRAGAPPALQSEACSTRARPVASPVAGEGYCSTSPGALPGARLHVGLPV